MTIRFNRNFGRRRMLQGLGVSAAMMPFLPTLQSAAGEMPAPKRFLVFFTPHGTVKEQWQPNRVGGDFELSPILSPLGEFKDRMAVLEGLNVYPEGPAGGHHTVGPGYVFCGSQMLENMDFYRENLDSYHGWPAHASIDFAISEHIGASSPFSSLQFGIQAGPKHPGSVVSYAGPDLPLPPQSSPQAMFAKVFGEAGIDPAIAAKLKAERKSILDVVKPELESVQGKVSKDDQLKIEAHVEGLRQIEQRLDAEYDCSAPELGPEYGTHDFSKTQELADQQISLLVESLACQATNVASLMFRAGENDNQAYPNLEIYDPHHTSSHAPDDDTEARGQLTTIYTWYAEQLAELARQLDAIPEGDGSVLDNTLIFWGTEISVGNTHSWNDMPFVLLGGSSLLRGDQYLSYEGESHCMLLTALGRAMGMNIDGFGTFDDGSGPLAEILV